LSHSNAQLVDEERRRLRGFTVLRKTEKMGEDR